MKVKFMRFVCDTKITRYRSGGGNAIQLVSAVNDEEQGVFKGEPIATATVNLEVPIADDEVIVKNYSENEGMLEALMEAGIVGAPLRYVSSGFIEAPVCKLLVA